MPLYVYRCTTCGHECEELQRLGADPPHVAEDCPRRHPKVDEDLQAGADDADARATADDLSEADLPCVLERQMTSASHRFRGDLTSDGVGGWTRNRDGVFRVTQGRNTTKYGEGSV